MTAEEFVEAFIATGNPLLLDSNGGIWSVVRKLWWADGTLWGDSWRQEFFEDTVVYLVPGARLGNGERGILEDALMVPRTMGHRPRCERSRALRKRLLDYINATPRHRYTNERATA